MKRIKVSVPRPCDCEAWPFCEHQLAIDNKQRATVRDEALEQWASESTKPGAKAYDRFVTGGGK